MTSETKKGGDVDARKAKRLGALQKTVQGLARIGALDNQTVKEINAFCREKAKPKHG